jgi:hypothetical protein
MPGIQNQNEKVRAEEVLTQGLSDRMDHHPTNYQEDKDNVLP